MHQVPKVPTIRFGEHQGLAACTSRSDRLLLAVVESNQWLERVASVSHATAAVGATTLPMHILAIPDSMCFTHILIIWFMCFTAILSCEMRTRGAKKENLSTVLDATDCQHLSIQ